MSNVTKTVTRLVSTATLEGATTPKIYNVTTTLANTEYSQALTADTKQLLIRCRDQARLQIAWESGDTGTTFVTLAPGTAYKIDGITYTGSVYFQSNKAGAVVEIEEWV
jgi:hypothetical protein